MDQDKLPDMLVKALLFVRDNDFECFLSIVNDVYGRYFELNKQLRIPNRDVFADLLSE